MGTEIEKKLNEAGYRMLGDEESIENLILDILKTGNTRYLKAIPFLFYKHKPDAKKIELLSHTNKTNELFMAIISITTKISRELDIPDLLPERLSESIDNIDHNIEEAKLDYKEFKDEFELQLRNDKKPSLFIDKQKIYAERDLQMNLSKIFTKKEKDILKALLEDRPITKTEYEYYSRKTKKKLGSIISLYDFAKAIYSKTPKQMQKDNNI